MSWFRVDDDFQSHEKVLRIPRAARAAAIGTWTLCGTWSAKHERDGFVPDYIVDELGGTIDGAEALVAVRLWRKNRNGYQFLNWSDYQPTRAQNDERRRAESARKADYRARKARESGGRSGDVPAGQQRDDVAPVPSRPGPENSQDNSGRPDLSSGPAFDDGVLSPIVQNVVDAVLEACSRSIHPLVAHDVIAWIDDRRGPKARAVQNPTRYYPRAIIDSWAELQKHIDQNGLAI